MSKVSRKDALKIGAVGVTAALATVIGGKSWGSGVAEAHRGQFHLDVAPDLSTFNQVAAPNQPGSGPLAAGPFYIEGPMFPPGTLNSDGTIPGSPTSLGTFRCWGWMIDKSGIAVVSQAYEIAGQGEIQVQGLEDGSRAVTGGTDKYLNVRGSGVFDFFPGSFSFRATFDLRGAGS